MFETTYTFKQFFSKIIGTMTKGMAITLLSAILSTGIIFYGPPSLVMPYMIFALICCFAELFIVFTFRNAVRKLDFVKARRHFVLYSIVSGISLGVIFTSYDPLAIIIALATTFAYFGLLYAITTVVDTDFSMVGSICVAALIPLLIVSFILFFIQSPALYWLTTYAGIAIFTGLTLYDFKRIETAYQQVTIDSEEPMILYLALELYLDFMNLFLYILRFVNRRNR